MSVLDTLITDRTQADVDYVRLLSKLGIDGMGGDLIPFRNGTLKGSYNYGDLNRVETAVEYMANALVQAQSDLEDYADSIGVAWDHYYDMPYDTAVFENIVVKKNWDMDDIPSTTDMNRYHGNLVLIRNAIPTNAPLPNSMNGLDYVGANQIEQMFLLVNEDIAKTIDIKKSYIDSTADAYRSGEIYSGEGEA